jgi:membrane-associated PAP2 superfamily phosphatase
LPEGFDEGSPVPDGGTQLIERPDPAGERSAWPRSWFRAGSPALLADPLAEALALIVVVSAVFLVFPGLDIWFSRLFYDSGTGFPITRLGAFNGLRDLGNDLLWLIVAVVVAALVIKLALPGRPSLIPVRDALFVLGTLIVGPGLIVNFIFKDHWGRPRPWRIEAFGGDQPFVGVWHMTNYCSWNCSFVSGEASSAIWLLTAVVLVPARWRRLALKVLFALAVLLSLNRIAMGGHFLSDALLAWGLTLAVIAIAYRLLYADPPAVLAAPALEDAATRAGQSIRQLLRRPPATSA